jgi:Fur family transcriptional regulator, ferric uptake regulator
MRSPRTATRTVKGAGTMQRRAILDAMASSPRFRTAQEVYSELRASGSRVGLTTVYRHLQQLAENGDIHALQLADRQTAYRLCGREAHYHLVCTECGQAVEIRGASLAEWVANEARTRGYSQVTHAVEIFGLCPTCAATDARRPARLAAGAEGEQ